MQVGAGQVCPGDVLPESVVALPHKRTVYLTLGTLFNGAADFDVPLEALRKLPVNVVVTCGYDVDPMAFEPLPRNVAVERWVSQALLLPRCSAVICHAGAAPDGAQRAACRWSVPRGADQFANAAQVTRTGAGITLLPGQVSVESIRDATHRVLDRVRAAAARKLRSEIELLPDPAAVVEELTSCVEQVLIDPPCCVPWRVASSSTVAESERSKDSEHAHMVYHRLLDDGLGRHLAEAVLARGCNAVVTARDAVKVQDLVDAYPNTGLALALDVTDDAQVTDAVQQARGAFRRPERAGQQRRVRVPGRGRGRRRSRRRCSSPPTSSARSR